jgi:hypothetical protein
MQICGGPLGGGAINNMQNCLFKHISKMKRARATSVPRLLSLVALVSLVLSLVLLVKFSRSGRRIWF